MKAITKKDNEIYIQKRDALYLEKVSEIPLFKQYHDRLKHLKKDDFFLVRDYNLAEYIKICDEIMDVFDFMMISSKKAEEESELAEQLYSIYKNSKKNYDPKKVDRLRYLYEVATANTIEKNTERVPFVKIPSEPLEDGYQDQNEDYCCYETKIKGLYVIKPIKKELFTDKDEEDLADFFKGQLSTIMVSESKEKMVNFRLTKFMSKDKKMLYCGIRKESVKQLRK